MQKIKTRLKQKSSAILPQTGNKRKTVTAYNAPVGISSLGLNPGFRIQDSLLDASILKAREKEQAYTEYSRVFANRAIQEEAKEDYPESRGFWTESMNMSNLAKEYGMKASFYESLRFTPASAAAVMKNSVAPKPEIPMVQAQKSGTSYENGKQIPVSSTFETSQLEEDVQGTREQPVFLERLKNVGISAGSEMLADYVQGNATTRQWLADQNIGSTKGYIEQIEIDLREAVHERDTLIEAGIPEDNPMVIQINETIQKREEDLEYVQDGQLEAYRENRRQSAYDLAESFYERSETAKEKAAHGVGTVGRFLVDTGIEGCKMLADAAVGATLSKVGIPHGALANRLVRSFGNGAYEAAEMGGGSNVQIAYGLANAAVDYAVNKFSLGNRNYDETIMSFTRGLSSGIKKNITLAEIVGSYSLNSLGEALSTMGQEVIDPICDLIIIGETDIEKVCRAADAGLQNFFLTFLTNVITHK